MKRFLFGSLALLALGAASAQAADMPVKARPMVAPIWSWTGFYVGANLGYSWGRSHGTDTLTNGAGTVLAVGSAKFNMDGVIGGGQIGYNWQQSNWVWGLEADLQGSGQKGSTSSVCPTGICSPPFGVIAVFPGPPVSGILSQKLEWFGTLRARAGFLVTPTTLVYGTGGLAYGSVRSDLTLAIPLATSVASGSSTRAGWTVGAGLESKLSANWSAKLEYLYVDLGNVSNSFATAIPALGGGVIAVNSRSTITDNILRVGVNYKLN